MECDGSGIVAVRKGVPILLGRDGSVGLEILVDERNCSSAGIEWPYRVNADNSRGRIRGSARIPGLIRLIVPGGLRRVDGDNHRPETLNVIGGGRGPIPVVLAAVILPCRCFGRFRAPDKKFAVQHESILSGGGTDSKITGDIGVVHILVAVAFNDFPRDGSADESVIPCGIPVDVIFLRSGHGGPAYVHMVPHHPVRGIFPDGFSRRGGQGLHAIVINRRYDIAERVVESSVIVRIVAHKHDRGRPRRGETPVQRHIFQCPRIGRSCPRTGQSSQGVIPVGQIHHVSHLRDGKRVHFLKRIWRNDIHTPDQSVRIGNADMPGHKNQNIVVFLLRVELERHKHRSAAKFREIVRPRPAFDIAMQVGNEVFAALEKGTELLQVVTGGKRGSNLSARKIAKGNAGHGYRFPMRLFPPPAQPYRV